MTLFQVEAGGADLAAAAVVDVACAAFGIVRSS